MSKIAKEKRNIVTLSFRQENDDPDYGTCLWADFYFDLDAYTLTIASDCGNYAYGWTITPSEPFLKLMSRINRGYLLDKISKSDTIDAKPTINELTKYVRGQIGRVSSLVREKIEDAVYGAGSTDVLVYEIADLLEDEGVDDADWYGVASCIEETFSANALKIGEIFETQVQPFLRKMREAYEDL